MSDQAFLLQVAFTPEELGTTVVKGARVVVLDVLRATSAVCAGLHAGIRCFRPVLTTEQSLSLAEQGFIPAAERDGLVAPGFEVGNSPLVFREPRFQGTQIALTTTNGTRALHAARDAGASEILVGAFLGLEVLLQELRQNPRPTVLLGSGWQGKFSWEDTLLAGALAEGLLTHSLGYHAQDDRVQAARSIWQNHCHDLRTAIRMSSHFARLASAGLEEDIDFCVQLNACPMFGRLVGEDLVPGLG